MDETIFRSLRGETTPTEERRLREWRSASPANEGRYRRMKELLELTAEAPLTAIAPSARQLIRRAERGDNSGGGLLAAAIRVAAVLALPFLGYGVAALMIEDPSGPAFAAREFVTGPGEKVTLHLSDGTVVRMAPQTRLVVTAGAAGREVTLAGRAYFAVARDTVQPFRVRTPSGEVTVLGTRFEVRAGGDEVRVVVVEGRVSLRAEGAEVLVGAGEMSRAESGMAPAVVKLDDPGAMLDWLDDFIAFESTPLTSVARELSDRYGMGVRITAPELEQETITAWFGERPLAEVLAVICSAIQASCEIHESGATIGR